MKRGDFRRLNVSVSLEPLEDRYDSERRVKNERLNPVTKAREGKKSKKLSLGVKKKTRRNEKNGNRFEC